MVSLSRYISPWLDGLEESKVRRSDRHYFGVVIQNVCYRGLILGVVTSLISKVRT